MPEPPVRPPTLPGAAVWVDDAGEWELGARDGERRRDGRVLTWRADGTPAADAFYRGGLLHGSCRRFHPDGSVAREATFLDGRPHGRTIAHGHEGPTPEPLQSCCVPPGAWRLEIDFDNGASLGIRWYDRGGVHILPSGAPHPVRPEGVPPEAIYDEQDERWVLAGYGPNGAVDGVWQRWSRAGVLREREEYRAANPHGLWQRFDEQGALYHESTWQDGLRHGPCRRIGVPADLYENPRIHEERGMFARDQAVGAWSFLDDEGAVVRRFDLGVAVDEEALLASPALAAADRPPQAWEAESAALEAQGRLGEAILAAARAAAGRRDAEPLRFLLARAAPILTADAALRLANEAVQNAEGKLAPLANGLCRGGDAPALLRAFTSTCMAGGRVALDLIDAALLLAPGRQECHVTRALVNVHLGRPAQARADAAVLGPGTDERAFLETYVNAVFPKFTFWPAGVEIRTVFPNVPTGPEQTLEAVRAHIQKYATRLLALRAALAARLEPGDPGDFLPPDLSGLLPEGQAALEAWEFEEIIVDDEGEALPIEPRQPTRVQVDERVVVSEPDPIPALMRACRQDWAALCWLCWSAGLEGVALPDALTPPAAFGHAAAMSVERVVRCRDTLTTGGLRSMTQGLPGFTWEGLDLDAMPRALAEIALQDYVEMRAIFYWLCDDGVQSPWQDNLRGD